ncbi:uncharacterized protein LOC106671905 isoform X2 [Cimex lectularius]|uniref:Uncharacterized protein n=1 Tax=Cimex lectularius TaxID=79782 RepID=A0A8I6SLH7_CIMLE|nr:uncharacterized protein LOC106671905 isoform X2 [Cimex lectularius]
MSLPKGWDDWAVPKCTEVDKENQMGTQNAGCSGANQEPSSPVSSTFDCLNKICTARNVTQSEEACEIGEKRILRPRRSMLIPSPTYNCRSCSAKYKRWESYYIHVKFKCLKNIYRTRRFACPFCESYSSNVRSSLAKHIVYEHVDKPDLSVRHLDSLVRHIVITFFFSLYRKKLCTTESSVR